MAETMLVYKVFRAGEWAEAVRTGTFSGSADDRRDGYVHLSLADQLAGVLARYFAREEGLVLAAFAAADLGSALRFEAATGGALYPHFYGVLNLSRICGSWPLAHDRDGAPILPPEVLTAAVP